MYRVVELGHIVAGPTAGLILSEMGFEVIKVERPGVGDIARNLTGESAGSFAYYNRNKKSVVINTKVPDGKESLKRLIDSADIVIDNFSSDFLKGLNLDYETLKITNPGLIYVSIRGYGKGKKEGRRSLDYPIEIDSGIAYMNGLKERPMRVGASLVDMFSASMAVIGIYDAILERERTGKGKSIDSSLFSNAMFMIGQHISTYQINQKELLPINEAGFAWGIYDFFLTSDKRKIFIAVTTDEQWKKFCNVFGIGEDFSNKYATNRNRYENRETLIPYLAGIISKYESGQLSNLLDSHQIVYSFLRKPWDLLNDEDALNGMNNVSFKGRNIFLPATPVSTKKEEHVPELGEDTEDVLSSLGFTTEEIVKISGK